MTVGSLFSGIGGFDLGFERAGFEIKWQVEIDPFCRQVLAKHWPAVRRYEDVRTVGAGLERVDCLVGGFPCQDISVAGKGAGIDGERSGLWLHFARLIGELRPQYVVVENVAALLVRGADRVLGDLAESGYDAEWDCIPASAVGAPHRRDRFWLVAYPNMQRCHGDHRVSPTQGRQARNESRDDAGAESSMDRAASMAHAESGVRQRPASRQAGHVALSGQIFSNADGEPLGRLTESWSQCEHWLIEPDVGRVAHGIPARVDRLRGLGNAIVPQIAEWIARRILTAEAMSA